MPDSHARLGHGAHLVLYDGVCGLCNGIVRFVLKRDRQKQFRFASLQSPAAAIALTPFGRTPDDLATFYVLPDYPGASRLLAKSGAAFFLLNALGWPWKALGVFALLPASMSNWIYDVVVRHRYRVFGRYDQCLLPRPDDRDRFLDV
jgi:predicted DCC family thiol-disulfide oxidoreductase YuxK